jgi:hypothetical protein
MWMLTILVPLKEADFQRLPTSLFEVFALIAQDLGRPCFASNLLEQGGFQIIILKMNA